MATTYVVARPRVVGHQGRDAVAGSIGRVRGGGRGHRFRVVRRKEGQQLPDKADGLIQVGRQEVCDSRAEGVCGGASELIGSHLSSGHGADGSGTGDVEARLLDHDDDVEEADDQSQAAGDGAVDDADGGYDTRRVAQGSCQSPPTVKGGDAVGGVAGGGVEPHHDR